MSRPKSKKNMLLLAGSRVGDKKKPGGGFLEYALPWIQDHFKDAIATGKPVLFIPYANPYAPPDITNEQEYVDFVRKVLTPLGINIVSPLEVDDPKTLLDADKIAGIFVGGGNTYRLNDELHKRKLLEPMKELIEQVPYLGSSAGSMIACPHIGTTNDNHSRIPPPPLDALGAIPFQLKCHFQDDDKFDPTQNGETHTVRIAEFQRENPDMPELGIREGTALKVEGDKIYFWSKNLHYPTARLFRWNQEPVEIGQDPLKDISRLVCPQRGIMSRE